MPANSSTPRLPPQPPPPGLSEHNKVTTSHSLNILISTKPASAVTFKNFEVGKLMKILEASSTPLDPHLRPPPPRRMTVGNFSSGGDASPSTKGTDVFLLDWTEPTPIVEEEQLNPQTERPPTSAEVEDVAVDSPEVDPPKVNTATQWLPVEDVLEEMRREEELNAPEEPPHNGGTDSDDLDGWSSPTIPSTDDDVGNHLDGQYNPYTSSEDSMYVEEQNYRSSSSSYQADESADESSESESATETFREKGDKYKTPQGLTPLEWMGRRNIQSWCKYFFDTSTITKHSLNNHCESFNKWILDAREMPILSCLETIRYKNYQVRYAQEMSVPHRSCYIYACFHRNCMFKMMKRIQENYVGMGSRDPESLCPNANDVIKERKKVAFWCYPTFSGDSPTLRAPTIETPRSGVKQKKRRREHGEVLQRKDKNGKTYSTVRKAGNGQRCTVCKKTGHNRRAHSSTDVTGSGVASTSATPATAQAAPEEAGASQQVVHDRAYVRVTRSKLNISRGGRTG
ncbi:hypothetical protein LINPERHAP1_LOCUS26441 [Linum perenne]